MAEDHYYPPKATDECLDALVQMPVKVLISEFTRNPNIEVAKAETIKVPNGFVTHKFRAIICDGTKGTQQRVPHAIAVQKQLARYATRINITLPAQVDCFIATTSGLAEKLALESLTDLEPRIINDPPGCTFEEYVKDYTAREGNSRDKELQLDGLAALRKPKDCTVIRWKQIFQDKNDAVDYCRGPGTKLTGTAFVTRYLKSFPQTWIASYHENLTTDLQTATMDSITEYMTLRENASAATRLKQAIQKAAAKA
jgi:hypothetical protein